MAFPVEILRTTFQVLEAVTSLSSGTDWETIKAQIGNLASEAAIATFLAAVQSQIIALSYLDNSTGVKVATNILGFSGVLLDVITAFLALLSSTILQRHIAIVEKQLGSIEDASPQQIQEVTALLYTIERRGFLAAALSPSSIPPDIRRRLYAKIRTRMVVLSTPHTQDPNTNALQAGGPEESAESAELNISLIPTSFTHIRSAASIGDAAGTAMFLGILCFFASVQCLAISTQPRAVWIVSAVICSFVVVLPVLNRGLGLFGIRLPSVFDI
ncbi:hypothetical protein C8R44DRAFT_826256 [Mycena epipterygia]|nr:hypothetical protein C8R44DRAFT_826256 [Mycena epipterygia]